MGAKCKHTRQCCPPAVCFGGFCLT
jgi:hypothetical protein